jgi:hypothetical protein
VRTTVTLDPDTEALINALMREQGITFKQAINEAIRRGLGGTRGGERRRYRTPTRRMGQPAVPLDAALRLAGELEDEELVRRLASRK